MGWMGLKKRVDGGYIRKDRRSRASQGHKNGQLTEHEVKVTHSFIGHALPNVQKGR